MHQNALKSSTYKGLKSLKTLKSFESIAWIFEAKSSTALELEEDWSKHMCLGFQSLSKAGNHMKS